MQDQNKDTHVKQMIHEVELGKQNVSKPEYNWEAEDM